MATYHTGGLSVTDGTYQLYRWQMIEAKDANNTKLQVNNNCAFEITDNREHVIWSSGESVKRFHRVNHKFALRGGRSYDWSIECQRDNGNFVLSHFVSVVAFLFVRGRGEMNPINLFQGKSVGHGEFNRKTQKSVKASMKSCKLTKAI